MSNRDNIKDSILKEAMADIAGIIGVGVSVIALAVMAAFLFMGCRSQKATAATEQVSLSSQGATRTADTVRATGKTTASETAMSAMAETERTKITIARDSAGRPTEIIKDRRLSGKTTAQRNNETMRQDTVAKAASAFSEKKASQTATSSKSPSRSDDQKYDGGYMKIGLGLCIFLFVINLATILWGKARNSRQ